MLPAICRPAVRDQENPRPIVGDSTLTIDLLPRIEHLQALLDGCTHRGIAARFKLRGRPERPAHSALAISPRMSLAVTSKISTVRPLVRACFSISRWSSAERSVPVREDRPVGPVRSQAK